MNPTGEEQTGKEKNNWKTRLSHHKDLNTLNNSENATQKKIVKNLTSIALFWPSIALAIRPHAS